MLARKLFDRYMGCAVMYGGVRKVLQTRDASLQTRDENHMKLTVPLLVSQRISIITLGALVSAVYLPYFLLSDIAEAELALRGLDPRHYDYSKPTTTLEYIVR